MINLNNLPILFSLVILFTNPLFSQAQQSSLLSIDRIYSGELVPDYLAPQQWVDNGDSYVRLEMNSQGYPTVVKYGTNSHQRAVLIETKELTPQGSTKPLVIESMTFSDDESKILFFTNSSRVWRANTKGDYWIYDLTTRKLNQIGKKFPGSSLMFAKFSAGNTQVAYVQGFNLYVEDILSGNIIQLTDDGGNGIINGTFDWVYEEEFADRDGFKWNPAGDQIAFWRLDASKTGTFYMIDNIDSVYSIPVPLQYPKVGQDPSECKVAVVSAKDQKIKWIPLEGSAVQNYIPGMQWISDTELLIQQVNRHQNTLNIWYYSISNGDLKKVYTEKEDTWVDLQYPDVSAKGWSGNDLILVDKNTSFLRLTETDGWRHLYKVDIATGEKKLLTPGNYDVASLAGVANSYVYFHASPKNSTQRYLFQTDLKGKNKIKRITPDKSQGLNTYELSPNGKYAIHKYTAALSPEVYTLVSLPNHTIIDTLVSNQDYKKNVSRLALPQVDFFAVTTDDGIEIDGRLIKPINFDASKKYPVLFHVYGEPWGQVATDSWIGLWNIMLAQNGYLVIDMDNRGTPCLKGSAWRKIIYRKVGIINADDQAAAAKAVLKEMKFVDPNRTAVWGWSGGGSMTLNLMFKYPEIYKAGMAVAGVSSQLLYDNIYQERYMGLPQENYDDFLRGSPVSYVNGLQGDLLVVHGTGDDNVHYQNMEVLVNELIRYNKQFQMMSYPNRSHGIYEGQNTRKHLYTLLTNFLTSHVPVN